MKISIIAGARPNFMKIAPIILAIRNEQEKGKNIHYRLVHTGQHYDNNMSGSFFEELNIPKADINLGSGGGTQAEQTAAIMLAFERELLENPADLVLVVGDVTSTLACSIVAKKLHTKVAHIEAGIRSFDLTMPEEINRMVTDSISDFFFTTSETANKNLRNSGLPEEGIFFVGNVMIDTLLLNMPRFKKPILWDQLNLEKEKYIVVTLHRPANVDEENIFTALFEAIIASSRGIPIIFPVHPRTRKMIDSLNPTIFQSLHLVEPMAYLEFNYLVQNAKLVITDSGGITEETTVMGIPCMTLRNSTERPETITQGTNELIGTNPRAIKPAMEKLFAGDWKKGGIPELWDGKAAERIISVLSRMKEFE